MGTVSIQYLAWLHEYVIRVTLKVSYTRTTYSRYNILCLCTGGPNKRRWVTKYLMLAFIAGQFDLETFT